MIVVADTTPLNYLILMRKIDILPVLYGRVTIPAAVRDEMLAVGAPAEVLRWILGLPEWLDVRSIDCTDSTLPRQLGPGERETISLALELHANVLLMDDQPARLAAEARGLFVSGTLSVILQASRRGLLDFEDCLAELKRLGFRMSAAVEEIMRAQAKSF